MDRTGSGSCAKAGLGIGNAESLVSITKQASTLTSTAYSPAERHNELTGPQQYSRNAADGDTDKGMGRQKRNPLPTRKIEFSA